MRAVLQRPGICIWLPATSGPMHRRLTHITPTHDAVHTLSPGIMYAMPYMHSSVPQATCDSQRGLLPPGLEELITIEFCPQQYRYYYDTVRVHSEVRGPCTHLHAWWHAYACSGMI